MGKEVRTGQRGLREGVGEMIRLGRRDGREREWKGKW